MKAYKGNCFVVMDKCDYDSKMESLHTYQPVQKSPFGRIERTLNKKILDLKNKGKLNEFS